MVNIIVIINNWLYLLVCRAFTKNTTDQSRAVSFALGANATYKKRCVQGTGNLKKKNNNIL